MTPAIVCPFCGREPSGPELSKHHLIPRARHNRSTKRRHAKEQLREKVKCCRPCHDHIHTLFTERELAQRYGTVEAIMAHPDMTKFVEWIGRKPSGFRPRIKR